MPADDWNHNRRYHRLLLRQLPAVAERVPEIGCGAGTLVGRLAAWVQHVDAVDRSPAMFGAARASVPADVALHLADALEADLPDGGYDAVVSSAVLHHLPLVQALPRMARWLAPGGVLAAVAVPRVDLPRDLPAELGATVTHHGLGVAFAALRPLTGLDLRRHEATHDEMPVADSALTTQQVRRRVLWRYLLTWRKPA